MEQGMVNFVSRRLEIEPCKLVTRLALRENPENRAQKMLTCISVHGSSLHPNSIKSILHSYCLN